MPKYSYDFILFIVAIIWGSGFIAADIAIEQWPPIFVTAMRFSIATLIFFVLNIKKLKNIKPYIVLGIALGFFLAMGFAFQTIALRYTTPSKNAFLTSISVIITPFLYLIFSRKLINMRIILGSVIAIVGIGILNFDGKSLSISNTGDILSLICAVFFSLHIYFTGYFLQEKQCDLTVLIFLQFLFAAIISWSAMFIGESPRIDSFLSLSIPSYAVIYLGIFPTLLCFFLQNFAQQKVNPNKTAIILSMEALFGTIFSIVLRNEVLTVYMIIGFLLLFTAVLIVELKLPKK